ncbi:MAG TPA: hypothetical protein VFW73_11015 [Lacipirellulaceae bacterium]|nr:hypothetical protein [Lacipirellulaceae bacterium]
MPGGAGCPIIVVGTYDVIKEFSGPTNILLKSIALTWHNRPYGST